MQNVVMPSVVMLTVVAPESVIKGPPAELSSCLTDIYQQIIDLKVKQVFSESVTLSKVL
jgi:hypothetical protein